MNPHLYGLPAPGDVVGDYRIAGLLGEGGHGHVYRAEGFGRSFAVKFMDPGLEAFGKREVQALMQLQHPGVVGFLGCGRWKDPEHGLFYVVMELVEGLTLYDYVMQYNPTARKVGEMVLSLGRTLLAVEEAGVLHRDVKRENIMVRLPSQEPVVLDFGLSTLRGAKSSGGSGGVTGTLEYLSPEAWEHARDEEERYRPTPKDEQWALGVTFYWMLTDRLAFGEREDPLMTRRVLREQPKAPHVINPRVPPELGAVCMRLLEKNPEDRYADLRDMCGELRRVLESSVGVESWEVPLGQPDAPECRTTDIDPAILAAQGIELEFLKIKPPRRGRVRKRLEANAPAVPPPEPPPEAAPVAEAEPAPIPGPAAVVVAAPVPEPAQIPPSPVGERQGFPEAIALASMGVPSDWSMFWRAARRAAAWTLMLSSALFLGPTPPPVSGELPVSTRGSSSAQGSLRLLTVAPALLENLQPHGEAGPFVAWQVGASGQKLEISPQSPESNSSVLFTSEEAAHVLAAPAAPIAVAEEDDASVKTPQKKTGLGAVKKTAAAATAALTLACPSAQVRPPPEPRECPPGAFEAMEKLGIEIGSYNSGRFPYSTFNPEPITVREGWTSVSTLGTKWGDVERGTVFSGQLIIGDRVYGRMTQATINGRIVPVCVELYEQRGPPPPIRGLLCEPGSSPGAVKIFPIMTLRAVDHFE